MIDFDSPVVDGVLAAVGVAALSLAVLVAYGPVPVEPIAALVPDASVAVVSGGAAVAVVAALTHRTLFRETETGASVELPAPPSATDPDRTDVDTAGDWIDDRLAKLRGEMEGAEGKRYADVVEERVVQRIRELAVEIVADAESCSKREAQRLLSTGEWTDRPRARVFLGDDVRSLPLSVRFRDWASGEAFDRQVRATVEELAALSTVDVTAELAPERAGDDEAGTDHRWTTDLEGVDDVGTPEGDGFYRPEMFDDDGEVAALELDATTPGDPDAGGDRDRGPERRQHSPATEGGERT